MTTLVRAAVFLNLMLAFALVACSRSAPTSQNRIAETSRRGIPESYTPTTAEEGLTNLRRQFALDALPAAMPTGTIAFHVFANHSLSGSGICVTGRIEVAGELSAGTLVVKDRGDSREFVLTPTQSLEVYHWFYDSEFLEPKTPEFGPSDVLDGVGIAIDLVNGAERKRIIRNAYDSPASRRFYERLRAFLLWAPTHRPSPSAISAH